MVTRVAAVTAATLVIGLLAGVNPAPAEAATVRFFGVATERVTGRAA
ncbi:hypothetical protein [Streptomyces atacamensis]